MNHTPRGSHASWESRHNDPVYYYFIYLGGDTGLHACGRGGANLTLTVVATKVSRVWALPVLLLYLAHAILLRQHGERRRP